MTVQVCRPHFKGFPQGFPQLTSVKWQGTFFRNSCLPAIKSKERKPTRVCDQNFKKSRVQVRQAVYRSTVSRIRLHTAGRALSLGGNYGLEDDRTTLASCKVSCNQADELRKALVGRSPACRSGTLILQKEQFSSQRFVMALATKKNILTIKRDVEAAVTIASMAESFAAVFAATQLPLTYKRANVLRIHTANLNTFVPEMTIKRKD